MRFLMLLFSMVLATAVALAGAKLIVDLMADDTELMGEM